MSNNYAEGFFQSVDTIISQRLNEVAFDKTEICEIILQDTTHKNKYYVSNGTLKYEAYAIDDTKTYTIGSRVYVTIPNGDYEARKLIMGIYAADEIPEDLYTNPFDYLVTASQIKLIAPNDQLQVNATKGNSPSTYLESYKTSKEVTFHYSGLGQFNYIGLNFSAITGFGGTKGEFQIAIDLLDADKNSLLTKTENGKPTSYVPYLTLSSKQLYGNPYYLNEMLYFQHLFPFPVANWFNDLTLVKHIKITLRANNNFNYEETSPQSIIINDLTLYFGYNSSEDSMSDTKVVLDWDNAMEPNYKRDEIEYDPTKNIEQRMSIDWRNTTTNAIYNETDNMQYPEEGKYNIYWLRYSESIGYKKMLETQASILIDCYDSDLQTYKNNLNNKDELKFNEKSLSDYDKVLFDKYVVLHKSTEVDFKTVVEATFIDIEESGTYWKTVQRMDAQDKNAYSYKFTPSKDWKKEQIKVIIKDNETGDYITADGLTFINKNFRSSTGSNQGRQDTLRLTLAEGDDGIYNSYGIDNKLLFDYDLPHRLTVNYIDNTDWDPALQKVIWKIPATATMIKKPSNDFMASDHLPENNFYIITTEDNYFKEGSVGEGLLGEQKSNGLHYIDFKLDDQFSYNKTNNTIYCKIIRYQDPNSDIITDEYEGSITLQFGLQNTAGTAFSFNIFPSQRSLGAKIDTDVGVANSNNIMTLTARFENDEGVPFDDALWTKNVTWSWYQYTPRENSSASIYELRSTIDSDTTNYSTLTGKQVRIRRISGKVEDIDNYAIVQAKLTGWQNNNGKTVDLVAYYPIAAGSPDTYLAGASRVIYNSSGTNPSYDPDEYRLSSDNDPNNAYTYELVSDETGATLFKLQYDNMYNPDGSIAKDQDGEAIINTHKARLKPVHLVPTNPPKMAIKVFDVINRKIKYIQPLLVLRNGYESKLLNDWDGAFQINEQDNYILSALMGAGVKNDDNTFTGVLMGAVGTEISTAKTGIYGMSSGALCYKLDENGDFYVGTGLDNRIDFSGPADDKKLTIEAKNFALRIQGGSNDYTKPDLYFGTQETGVTNNDSENWLRFKEKIYFKKDGTVNIGGWTIGTASLSWTNTAEGAHDASRWLYFGQSNSASIPWNNSTVSVALRLGNNFGVTKNGKLYASGIDVQGKVHLNSTSQIDIDESNTVQLSSYLKVQSDSISAKVDRIIDADNQESMDWNLTSADFIVQANGTQVLKVDSSGLTITGKGTFSGALNAATGSFKGSLEAATGSFKGSLNINDKFIVNSSGNVQIKGTLTVSGTGSIAGWNITSTSISKGSTTLSSSGTNGSITTGNLTMTGGSITLGTVFKAKSDGTLELTNSVGYFEMGPTTLAGDIKHPYVSGLNVAGVNGISIRDATGSYLDGTAKEPSIKYVGQESGKLYYDYEYSELILSSVNGSLGIFPGDALHIKNLQGTQQAGQDGYIEFYTKNILGEKNWSAYIGVTRGLITYCGTSYANATAAAGTDSRLMALEI